MLDSLKSSYGNGYFSQAVDGYAKRMKPEQGKGAPKTFDDMVRDEMIQRLLGNDRRAPYSAMADENGIIEYKGVTFQCDYEHNRLCLGNVSDVRNCITVELEGGGVLVFNRANVDDLVKAIDMFSPTDINRIMRAIAQDAKLKQIQMEIEDETSGERVLDKPEDEGQAEAADRLGGEGRMEKSEEER